MNKVDIAGLQIDAITIGQFLTEIEQRLAAGEQTFVTTPYSEFLYAGVRDREVMELLNKADIAIADGIGILWAQRFLSIPFTAKGYYSKIVEALWQMVYTGAGILLYPKSLYNVIPEKITGANIIWDLAELAAEKSYSIYLLGGFGQTPHLAAQKLQQRFPNLKVVGASNKSPGDESVIADIKKAEPDMLLVAYGPIRQERWIVEHRDQLPAKLFIGLGGTFDYIAGTKLKPPQFVRSMGLEWLYRLITQPTRIKRIFQATIGLIMAMIRYKVFMSLPYRSNVACIIFNDKGEILVCRRNPDDSGLRDIGQKGTAKYNNYWQFPQGGIDTGEDLNEAAIREVREETNIVSAKIISVSDRTNDYFYHNARRPLFFNDTFYKGQSQKVAYLHFSGSESEIKVDNDEFIDYQWVNPKDLLAIVHAERAGLANIVLSDLQDGKIEIPRIN